MSLPTPKPHPIDPPGEPHHRRIAYDAANKHVFVANRAMDRVEVFSSIDQTRISQLSIPAATASTFPPIPQRSGSAPHRASRRDRHRYAKKCEHAIPSSRSLPLPNSVFNRPKNSRRCPAAKS